MNETSNDSAEAQRQSLQAEDGRRILVDLWSPAQPVALIHLFHGLGEHPARYERFAKHCNQHGIAIATHNHRGHGENCPEGELGHYADTRGWDKLISDAALVQATLVHQLPGVPLILLGHSMGSYIAQSFVMRGHGAISALILSGSAFNSRLQLRLGHWIAAIESLRIGKKGISSLLNKMSFEGFNKGFAPNRTAFDWLSRDQDEVDKYVADPLCGADSSCRLWFDLTGGLLEVTSSRALRKIRSDLPILITGGEEDPVSGQVGLSRLAQEYEKSGHTKTSLKIYPEARHEMFNETNREEFFADVTRWLSEAVLTQSE